MMKWKDFLNYLISLTRRITKILLLFLILLCSAYAQLDTVDAVPDEADSEVFVMQKSPWGAVLRSAVLPGWGQFYNESYFKIPVIWGISAWLLYIWIDNNDSYIKYRQLYANTPIEQYRSLRTFYRDQRDLFTIYIALVYVLNLVDAYVDAHLFDFSVEENFMNGSPMFGIKFNF